MIRAKIPSGARFIPLLSIWYLPVQYCWQVKEYRRMASEQASSRSACRRQESDRASNLESRILALPRRKHVVIDQTNVIYLPLLSAIRTSRLPLACRHSASCGARHFLLGQLLDTDWPAPPGSQRARIRRHVRQRLCANGRCAFAINRLAFSVSTFYLNT